MNKENISATSSPVCGTKKYITPNLRVHQCIFHHALLAGSVNDSPKIEVFSSSDATHGNDDDDAL